MAIVLDPQEPAINRGIKTVGIGKRGSKPLAPELVLEILEDLKSGKVSEAAKGAFFAGLYAKGIEPQEEILERAFDPETIASDAPEFVQWACRQLLKGHTLDKHTAYDLGKFLFSDEPSDAARGWVASFLRVRYETDDEYEGLLQAMDDTLAPPFKIPAPKGEPIIQIAEPFDGVDHSYMITPLVGEALQKEGYRVVHQAGRNSGPKSDMNLWDIARALGIKPALSNADLAVEKSVFGWFFHQSLMSPALDRWVDLRRQIIKRPFLATLERLLNGLKSDILIASAFHPPYAEKMMNLAQHAGFKGIIIVRNGIEGTIAFPLLRDVKLLLSARQKDGSFQRHEMIIENESSVKRPNNIDIAELRQKAQLLRLAEGGRHCEERFSATKQSFLIDREEMIKKPKALDNANLIETYIREGASGNNHFDLRVKITCEGLKEALTWLHCRLA